MYQNDDKLEHYGVKGMKWGVRKVKSSLKKSSKKRKAQKKAKRASAKANAEWGRKYQTRKSMSDADLKKAVERLRMENEFAKQVGISNTYQPKSAGKRFKEAIAGGAVNTKNIQSILNNVNGTYNSGNKAYSNGVDLAKVAFKSRKLAGIP